VLNIAKVSMTNALRTYCNDSLPPECTGEYRSAFNGMESVPTIYGEGNAYDFGARMYDGRLGRWLSLDPAQQEYPMLSAYSLVGDCPLNFIDPDGKKIKPTNSDAQRLLNLEFDRVLQIFPEIRSHVQLVQIGTDQNGRAVNAFVYVEQLTPDNNSPELNVIRAKRLIIDSQLSPE